MTNAAPKPLLDIVVLVHDRADWADLCVRAVENLTSTPYRLIIVDSASVEQKTQDFFKDVERRGHTVVRLAENRSFSNGVNAGVMAGDAKFICLLNDDAIVTDGWDKALVQDLVTRDIGMTGARSNAASGPQSDPSFIGEPPFLVFVCVALRRDVWNAVGPLDEVTFDGFSTEDIDYSWRVKKAGYKLKVSNAFVLHAGSRTIATKIATTVDAQIRNNQKYNQRLIEKWGKEFAIKNSLTVKKVLVASHHATQWCAVDFMDDFVNMKAYGGYAFHFIRVVRTPIHIGRTAAANAALDGGFDYLVQLDDDARFPPDTIRRLLVHQKDVVTSLAYQRKPPHMPCIFEIGEDGIMGAHLEGWEHTGLRRVDAAGFHVSATATSVFKRMRAYRSETRPNGIQNYYGSFGDKVGEDFAFSLACKEIGVQIYCDTEFIAGHMGDAINVNEEYRQKFVAGRT